MNPIILLSLLLVKHFLIDFVTQTPYHYLNKGKYGHPGGMWHAAQHAAVTSIILLAFTDAGYNLSLILGFIEYFAHYHIDYAKVNINKAYELTPGNSEYYWWLLGFDQLLHQACYVLIVLYLGGI